MFRVKRVDYKGTRTCKGDICATLIGECELFRLQFGHSFAVESYVDFGISLLAEFVDEGDSLFVCHCGLAS